MFVSFCSSSYSNPESKRIYHYKNFKPVFMRHNKKIIAIAAMSAIVIFIQCSKTFKKTDEQVAVEEEQSGIEKKKSLIAEGKETFRFDTFGDEDFWSGLLHIDKAIAGELNGGFGAGVSPAAALGIGLKVDVDALPAEVRQGIISHSIDLNDPAITLALLKLNSVVGVKGNFNQEGTLQSIGITCAVCHSTVDNSFIDGIGKRLDGWPNRDLDVGGIISLTDNALPIANLLHVSEPTLRNVLDLWGRG